MSVFNVLDTSRPDPFDHAGYIGIFDRASHRARYLDTLDRAGVEPDPGFMADPDVAYYGFPNGYTAAVVLGTPAERPPSLVDPERPFEMAVMHGRNLKLCYANAVSDGDVVGPLDHDGVRAYLDAVAALEPNPSCEHRRGA